MPSSLQTYFDASGLFVCVLKLIKERSHDPQESVVLINDAGSFGGRGNRTLARKPLVFNLIQSQLTPALRLQRVHTSIDPLTIEVQEIPSLGMLLLDATGDYNVRFDFSVGVERRFAVAPA
jgi:hypothetical protein